MDATNPPPSPPTKPRKPRKPKAKRVDGAEKTPKQQEMDAQTTYAVKLLAKRAYKHEIFALLKVRYPKCSARTCERIMARAREVLREQTGRSRQEHREDAYAFYDSILRDPEARIGEKLLAQARIDSLMGLTAPLEHRHGQSDQAGPVQTVTEVVVRTREEARRLLAEQEAAAQRK